MSLEAEDKYKQAKANYVGARKNKYDAWDAYVNAKNASPYSGEAVKQAKDNYYAASDAFKQSKAELVGAKAALKKSKQNPVSSDTQNTESSGTQNTETTDIQNTESSGTQNTETTDTQNTEQKSESAVSGAAKAIEEGGKRIGLSDSFYRDVGAAIKGQPTGNTLDAAAATAAAQSKNLQNDAARREMEGQRAQQVANRNVYGEAGKIASMQNDAQSRQNVQNTSFAAGNAAALKRANNAPDVQAQIARQDQQQNVANERREQADTQTQAATEMEGNKKQFQIKSRDHDNDMNDSSRLSLGEGGGTSETQQTQTQQTQEEQPEPGQTQTQQTQEEQPEPEQTQEPISGNPQHVINGLLGSSKGQDLRSGEGGDDKALYDWAIQQGVTPLQPGKQKSQNPNDWEQEFIEANGAKGQEVIQKLREGRAMPGNDASTNFDASNYDQMNKSMQVPSDARVKNVRSLVDCLSDIRMKHIKEDFDNYGRCSSKDFDWLLRRIGKLRHNNREYDPFNEADWEDDTDSSVLNAYADHIRNYVYTYKPEAVEVDSRIDPEQEHIGPMAQDIEQVNPACVKETADGVKTVDSARLAMMNAGAIGELARQLNELNMKFQALGL